MSKGAWVWQLPKGAWARQMLEAAWAGALMSVWSSTVRAETGPVAAPASVVELRAPPCIERPFDRAGLVELLRVELGALGVTNVVIAPSETRASSSNDVLLAAVVLTPATCDPAASEVTLEVLDRASSKKVERRMTIGDVEFAGRPRALAIAIAELLQASWAELALAGAAPPAVPLPSALRTVLAARIAAALDGQRASEQRQMKAAIEAHDLLESEVSESRHQKQKGTLFELSFMTRDFPTRSSALLGGEAAIRRRLGEHGSLEGGLGAGFGGTEVGTGAISMGAVTGHFGLAATTGGATELEIGPRLDIGYGFASGTSSAPGVKGASYGNAVVLGLLQATLRLHTESWWTLLVGLDLGHSLADVSFLSDASHAAGIGGVVIDARVGLGARL